MGYLRLKKRDDICLNLYDNTHDVKYLEESYCINSFFETGLEKYEYVYQFAARHNIQTVIDIGCGLGHQSEVFLNSNIEYIGIDEYKRNFWNTEIFKFIVQRYPFNIEAKKETLAVSILCLTWNCYLQGDIKLLEKQCEQLAQNFKQCLLYMDKGTIDTVKKYFKYHTILTTNFVYFYN